MITLLMKLGIKFQVVSISEINVKRVDLMLIMKIIMFALIFINDGHEGEPCPPGKANNKGILTYAYYMWVKRS
jgi:hypothetical protein